MTDAKAKRREEVLAWMRALPELPTGLVAVGCLYRDFAAPLEGLELFAAGARCRRRNLSLEVMASLVFTRRYRWYL